MQSELCLQITDTEFEEFIMSLDGDHELDAFVDSLTSANVLYMSNEDPDVRVYNVLDEKHLAMLIGDCFGEGDSVIQMVLENKVIPGECTHIKVIMQGVGSKKPINYKLETLMKMVKHRGCNFRCDKAIVVGLDGMLGNMVNLPSELSIGYVPEIGTLVAGEVVNCLGKRLPCEMLWHVMSYLCHPVAEIMKDHIVASSIYTDMYLAWMCELDRSGLR